MSEMSSPLISVIIPAYNAEGFIKRAIESVLQQKFSAFEIVVVDDGSIDSTRSVVKSIAHPMINYVAKENGGASSARNVGVKMAKGDWIAFLDSDDTWVNTHLENFVSILKQNQGLYWYGAPIDVYSQVTLKPIKEYKKPKDSYLVNNSYFTDYLSALPPYAFFATPTMVIKKEVFENVGFFNENQKIGEDIDLWFRIGLHYPEIGYTPAVGAIVYRRENSLSNSTKWQPDVAVNRFLKCQQYAEDLGENYRNRSNKRIAFWAVNLLRSSIRKNDFKAVKMIKTHFGSIIPFKYKLLVTLFLPISKSIRLISSNAK